MPVDAFDVGPVSSKDALLVAGEEVPDPDGAVVGTGREFLVGENEHPLKSGLSCCTFSLLNKQHLCAVYNDYKSWYQAQFGDNDR